MSEATVAARVRTEDDSTQLPFVEVIASTLVFWNFALAAPLLDLLGRSAEFFVAHRATRWTVVGFAVALTVGLPMVVAAVTLGIGRLNRQVGLWWHSAVVAALSAGLCLVVLNRLDLAKGMPAWPVIAIALLLGASISFLWLRVSGARSFVNFASPAPLVVLGLFLFASPASSIVLAGSTADSEAVFIDAPYPVTIVVFDEFPVASIMDAEGGIDGTLFPNFARLAETATWYPNAVTVDSHTRWAVPAILSGRRPSRQTLPVSGDHPRTLFTALGGGNPRYTLNVHETMTQLCPASLCADDTPDERLGASMWDDLQIVAAHVLAPAEWRTSLPPIDNAWAGFQPAATDDEGFEWDKDAIHRGHDEDFRSFVASIDDLSSPTLNFLHLLLPHGPWRYLPSGVEYQTVPVAGRQLPLWGENDWLIAQAYQRHLMQVAFADKLVGELLDRLETIGVFEETMLVLAADHGVAFQAGKLVRGVEPANLGELAAVPLFIKQPNQREGDVDTRAARTTDILPTVFDALDVTSSWDLEGRSLLEPWAEERSEHVITHGEDERLPFAADDLDHTIVAQRKYRIFDSEEGQVDLFRLGPPGTMSLIGQQVDNLEVVEPSPHSVALDEPHLYQSLSTDRNPFPALVMGRVERQDDPRRVTILAVAVDGVIQAVTETFNPAQHGLFRVMIQPEVLLQHPDFAFFEVVGTDEDLVLHRLQGGDVGSG